MADVLDAAIDPGPVLDHETGLDGIGEAYRAMDERRAIKSLIRSGRCDHRLRIPPCLT
jgi:hypothetical protein